MLGAPKKLLAKISGKQFRLWKRD
jgi:hypothetical protein